MASDRVGVAANIKAVAPLADYFHCAMHGLNYQQDAAKPVFITIFVIALVTLFSCKRQNFMNL